MYYYTVKESLYQNFSRKNSSRFPHWSSRNKSNEEPYAFLHFLAWYGSDITDMVSKCKGCILAAKSPPTSQEPWPKTDRPWSRIHIDFAGPIDRFYYFVVVDIYSKWP